MKIMSSYVYMPGHAFPLEPELWFDKKEVGYYSQVTHHSIAFDKRNLKPFRLPSAASLRGKKWNVRDGYQNFKSRVFKRTESMVQNLLLTTIKYEYDHKSSETFKIPQILCHSGLFKDILADTEKYEVIPFDSQLIFVGTNRRYNQDPLISFSGIRFEDLMETNDPTVQTKNNFFHFKSLDRWELRSQQGYPALTCLTVTEIDAVKQKSDEQNFEQKSPGLYTEIKMIYACPTAEYDDDVLDILRNTKQRFGHKLFQWIIQCKYGMSKYLLIGLRGPDYNIWKVGLYNIDYDVIPYIKKYFKSEYAQYQYSSDKLFKVLKWVQDSIENSVKESGNHDYPDVFEFNIRRQDYELKKLPERKAKNAYDTAMIKDFLEWRRHGKNKLSSSDFIFHKRRKPKRQGERDGLQVLEGGFKKMQI